MVIDTTILIEYLRARNRASTTLNGLPDDVPYRISSVTKYELLIGATDESKWRDAQKLLSNLTDLPMMPGVALKSVEISQALRSRGMLIGHRDIFIAATAIVNGLPIKTLNTKDFSRIPGLVLV